MDSKNGKNYIPRLLDLPQAHSFFLFGPRNTGKSTLIRGTFSSKTSLYIDLLKPELEEKFERHPSYLAELVEALPETTTHVIIDEIQKIPKLLDVVHSLMGSTNKHFIMTGSSARKLKAGGANLLAGRAYVYDLHALSFLELNDAFHQEYALQWGMLPEAIAAPNPKLKTNFLQAYAHTYLKEEIWAEQFIKTLKPFRYFLEVAAQSNGQIINFSKIAKDTGVDIKTIQNYYTILEDTLIGFFIEGFKHSFRKRLSQKPKFYFFDTGVARALQRTLNIPLKPRTSAYGDAFEHLVITECHKLISYYKSEYRMSYLRTKDDAEIDLVIDRPGLPFLFIEIKSTNNVTEDTLSSFIQLTNDFNSNEALCLSNDPLPKKIKNVTVLPWQEGLKRYFTNSN